MEFMPKLHLNRLIVGDQQPTASTDDEGDESTDEDGNTSVHIYSLLETELQVMIMFIVE